MAIGNPLKISDYKPITTDAPDNADIADTTKCYLAYPKDPMKEIMVFFEMQSAHMDPIVGPVVFNIWARTPARLEGEEGTGLEWNIVDEWLLESISGPMIQPTTWAGAFDYYYIQRKSGTDSLNAMLGYEPDQGIA